MPHGELPTRIRQRSLEPGLVVVAALAASFALVVLFRPALHRAVFVYGDLGTFYLPMKMLYADNLARGQSSLWLPNLFCGFYLHGEGQVGLYHPLHWLLYRLLPLDAAFNLECALGYPLMLAGVASFLVRLRLPTAAAMFGGIAFAFCGFVLVRLTHPNVVGVIAHLPWLLWATDLALREPGGPRRDRARVAIALLRGSQLLLGYPGAVYLSMLCEALYALSLAVSLRRVRGLLWLGGANLVGIGIGAIQLLPTIEQFAGSLRADTSFEYRTSQSLHPLSLLQPWAPYLFRDRAFQVDLPNPVEQAFYLGAVVPVAAAWVALRWRQLGRMRPILVGALGASALGVALALGRYSPLFRAVAELPLVGQLRVPSRYTLLVCLAGALVAAVGYADLLRVGASHDRAADRRTWRIWWAVLPSALVAVVALLCRGLAPPERLGSLRPAADVLLGLGLSVIATGLWFAAARGLRSALVGLVLFTVGDQAAYGASLWWSVPPLTVTEYVASIARPPVDPPHRLLDGPALRVHRNARGQLVFSSSTSLVVHGTRLVHGHAGLIPARRLDYRDPRALRVAGVSAALTGSGYVQVPGALGRFRLVDRVVVSEQPASTIGTIDVATTAIVEVPLDLVAGPAGSIRVREDAPGRIALTTESPTRQLLVISESYHPGWTLTIDGVEGTIVRVYGDFMGAVIGAGSHEVALRFDPRSFRIGRSLSGSAAGLLVVVAAWQWRRRRDVG